MSALFVSLAKFLSSSNPRRWLRLAALVPMVLVAACAAPQPGPMPVGGPTAEPIGSVLFCTQHVSECAREGTAGTEVVMTPRRWDQLGTVQSQVNRDIAPSSAVEIAWHYVKDGRGNCVQYALEKRRRLIALGWPAGALRLATAITRDGIGHLVLVVTTSKGDWVLDNLRRSVVPWDDLPYRWVSRQQGASMAEWVSLRAAG